MSLRDENRVARHQVIWDAACELGLFTYDDLAKRAEVSRSNAQDRVRGWLRDGLAVQERHGSSRLLHFRVLTDPAERENAVVKAAPPEEGVEANCWRVMRKLTSFTPTDVAAHATTDSCGVGVKDARDYCQLLMRAGYLRAIRKALPGKRDAVYRLIKDTGPLAPRLRRVRAVEDRNQRTLTHIEGSA
jgi:hypothetical protein